MNFHLLHAERFDLEPEGHPLKELIFKVLQKDQPVLLGSDPKAKVPVLLNRVEKQLLASADLGLPLLSQLGSEGHFGKEDTLAAEVAGEARLLLSMGEIPAKKSQEKGDVEVVSVDLVESHHLLQHVTVRFCIVPDGLTLEERVFLVFRLLVQLLGNILHRHIQIFPPYFVGRLPQVNTVFFVLAQLLFQIYQLLRLLPVADLVEADVALEGVFGEGSVALRGEQVGVEEGKRLVLPEGEFVEPGSFEDRYYFVHQFHYFLLNQYNPKSFPNISSVLVPATPCLHSTSFDRLLSIKVVFLLSLLRHLLLHQAKMKKELLFPHPNSQFLVVAFEVEESIVGVPFSQPEERECRKEIPIIHEPSPNE